jgi:predicted O-methyltransferase YrrM
MKLLKFSTLILLLVFILFGLDIFTVLSNNWRFYGWEMFVKSGLKPPPTSVNKPTSKRSSSGKGLFPDTPYFFTHGWFLLFKSDWENHLKEFKGKPDINALEIGGHEGLSTIWQLENILTDPTSTITSIDIFLEKEIEDRFDLNIEATGVAYKVTKLKGSSEKMLRNLTFGKYDYVHIDGSHLAKFVLSDAVLSWDLIKPNGLIIFDDYNYLPKPSREDYSPTGIRALDIYLYRKKTKDKWTKPSLDAFLKIYGPYIEVVFKKYQVVVRKKPRDEIDPFERHFESVGG